MKIIAVSSLVAGLGASFLPSAHASAYSDFEARVRAELIKPFARDLGGVLGAASFHPGRALGFPGFEVGVVGAIQFRPDKDNRVMRDAGIKAFGLPLVQAAVGLPLNIDVAVHGISASGLSIFGGGLRYGIFKSGLLTKFIPSVGVSAFGDKVNYSAFSAVHYAANASAVWDLPIISPFAGVGFDSTKVEVKAASTPGVNGLSGSANGYRLAVGADITPLPFTRLRASYLLIHGIPGVALNAGVKF